MKNRKLMALATSVVLATSLFAGCGSDKTDETTTTTITDNKGTTDNGQSGTRVESTNEYGLCENIEDGTILHCFSWSFQSIMESLDDIALSGYTSIQTSPINACYDGGDAGVDLFGQGKWYYHYQPTDWTIGNYQLGTKEEFKALCDAAHERGIKVIVDVVPNHTTKSTDAISADFIEAVGGMDKMYHSDGYTAIVDYKNRKQCTLNASGGLYDVNTENPKFQDYFISYLNECIDCGADGFRYDTAKHIGLADDPQDDSSLPNNFWDRVTTEITDADKIFNYGEVLQDGGERINDYIDKIGATTASSYGSSLRSAITTANLTADSIKDLKLGSDKTSVVTWVESHDNYTGTEKTYSQLDNTRINLGWTILAARNVGTPLFFSRPYGATASNMWGTFNKIGMSGDFLYKDSTVVAANHFRNAMNGLGENLFNPSDATNVLFIERGTKGLVIVNASSFGYDFNESTNLEDGDYIDRVDGSTTYTVKDGKISGSILGKTAIVLYNEGYVDLKTPALVKVDDSTSGTIIGDSVDVTLVAEDAKVSKYKINDGEYTEYSNGDTVTIGSDIVPGEIETLTVYGENEAGKVSTMTYIFKKIDAITSGTKIYFEKPADWADTIYAYIYDETSYSYTKESAAWPGAAMTLESDGTYSYTFTSDWLAPLVIFTDGHNQSNGQMEPGAVVVKDKVYSLN